MINAIGDRMSFEIARQQKLAKAIEQTQISISTGKRMQVPSDDPAASVRVAAVRRAQADGVVWQRNIDLGSSLAGQADGVLKTLNDHLARAQELLVQGASQTLPQSARDTIAAEMRSIAQEVSSLRGTQSSLGTPLFSEGPARQLRFADDVVFAPVPSQADVFESNGTPIDQQLQAMASAVQGGQRADLDQSLTGIESLVRHGADAAASIGNAAARLDRLSQQQGQFSIDLSDEQAHLEGTDLTSAIATLNSQQLTLEASQAAFARINRKSLIDLLG